MLKMETEDTGTVVITASGKLSKADYDSFVPEFDSMVRKGGPLRLLINLDDFHGWDIAGLWEELRFDATHQKDIGRVAIVGDRAWQEWGTRLSRPFFKAQSRFFERGQEADARAWLSAS